ncbi:MAG: T9SS type A sorting domain-containing protein [Bacteroidia bacterium]|nr:T9SS type A sorting domain-containing protein [Bacteroidia bacterium]
MTKNLLLLFVIIGITKSAHADCKYDTVYYYRMQQRTVKYVKVPDSRDIYYYNADGQPVLVLKQYPSWKNFAIDSWRNSFRIYHTYNNNKQLIQTIDETGGYYQGATYYSSVSHTYDYDANGKMILDFYKQYDSTQRKWLDWNKKEYLYAPNKKEYTYTVYKGGNGGNFTKKEISTFNSNNTTAKFEVYTPNGANWRLSYQYDYTYNNDNDLVKVEYSTLNITTMQLQVSSETTYEYYSAHKIKKILQKDWNSNKSILEDYSKIEYSYPTNTMLKLTHVFNTTWDLYAKDSVVFNNYGSKIDSFYWYISSSPLGTYSKRQSFERSGNNEIISRTDYSYSNSSKILEPVKRRLYTFENNKNTSFIDQSWSTINLVWNNSLLYNNIYYGNELIGYENYFRWDNSLEQFTDLTGNVKICNSNSTNLSKATALEFKVYPNPITDNTFKIVTAAKTRFQLFNCMGKSVHSGELVIGENTITLPQTMGSGIYFIRVGNTCQKINIAN